ncbi:hypothetical protein GBA52_004007 [Prunus armeniaca]|nr:hypothetical protein GBA52_004007 [Prunus armeniaca]
MMTGSGNRNNSLKWKRKIMDAMEMDFSWDVESRDALATACDVYLVVNRLGQLSAHRLEENVD